VAHRQKNGAVSKVDNNLFFPIYMAIIYTVRSGNCPSSHALSVFPLSCLLWGRGTSFQDGVAAGENFCVLRFEVSRYVVTVQRQFHALFKEDAPHKNNVFFQRCRKLTLQCNHRSGHLKTEHTESLLLMRLHLGNWSRGPSVSIGTERLVAHEKRGQFPLLTVYILPV
jgi:hypothetical protein